MGAVFDDWILRTRRGLADIHDKTTGAVITAATQDGAAWRSADLTDICNDARVEYIDFLHEKYGASGIAKVIPELVKIGAVPLAAAVSGMKFATGDLPADFGYWVDGMISLAVSGVTPYYQLFERPYPEWWNLLTRGSTEADSYYVSFANGQLQVYHYAGFTTGSDMAATFSYISTEQNFVAGAVADTLINRRHTPNIVKLAVARAKAFKAQ